MKNTEFKLRITNAVDELIDVYFGEENIIDKLVNSTLKMMVDTNIDNLDEVINMFADANGNINAETIVTKYAQQIGEKGVSFDLKDYIKSDFVRGLLPNKSLIITQDDIYKILPEKTIVTESIECVDTNEQ